jgi:polar amino acid transport system substrate-binding protein
MISAHVRRTATAVAASTMLMLVAAGCGTSGVDSGTSSSGNGTGTGTNGGSTTATKVDSIANEVPPAIKSKGKVIVAADASYAPNEFIGSDGTTVEGMDADLANALGQVMGLQVEIQNQKFDNIIPGLGTKYDVGMSSFTDTKEREKTVDFVTYFSAGTSFFVKKGGPAINSLADLCGHTVAVESGTTQESDANGAKSKCSADKPITVSSFPDQNQTNLALSSGRADVSMADSPVAAYQVKQSNGLFQLSGQPYGTAPYGIALPKGNGMTQPVLDAMKELIKDGVYMNILKKWGVEAGAITTPATNQGS